MLRFEISMSKISAAREELRIASTNYDYVSNFNHLMNNSDYTRIKTEADRLESSMGNLKFSTPNYDSIHRQMSRQWQSLQDQLRKIEQGAIAGPSKKLESAKFRLATAETNQLASPQ